MERLLTILASELKPTVDEKKYFRGELPFCTADIFRLWRG
jgi:hypothetical protein